jgi:CBS domain-containing protein
VQIGEVMRTAATIYRAVSINDAADMMVHNKIHRIPVVGEDDTLVGIITRSDILKATLQDFR